MKKGMEERKINKRNWDKGGEWYGNVGDNLKKGNDIHLDYI